MILDISLPHCLVVGFPVSRAEVSNEVPTVVQTNESKAPQLITAILDCSDMDAIPALAMRNEIDDWTSNFDRRTRAISDNKGETGYNQ